MNYKLGKWFCLYADRHYLWFRFGAGYGLHFKHNSQPLTFQERAKAVKYLRIGKWRIKIIKPIKYNL